MVTYPKEWGESEIGILFDVSAGGDVDKSCFSKSKTIKQPYEVFSNSIDNQGLYGYTSKPVYPGDSITVTARGTIGKAFYRANPYDAIIRLLVLTPQKNDVSSGFYTYFINNNIVFEDEHTGVPQLTAPKIKKIKVPKPSLPEQDAISETLSCIDDNIANLTELIEKKKAIRDGALESLVSGRTRLDGVSGEWNTMPLSKFTAVNPRTDIPDSFIYVDLESVKGISLVGQRRENKYSAPSRARRLAQKGDVFFQTVRPYQKNNYLFDLDGDYVFSTGYAQLRTNNDPNYLFLLIRQDSFVNCVLDNCTGTSYPAINPKKLSEIEVYVPIDIEEQRAIAQIIMVMDTEIASLEEEKDKIMQIKSGAMDDLLTGRVRLSRQGG